MSILSSILDKLGLEKAAQAKQAAAAASAAGMAPKPSSAAPVPPSAGMAPKPSPAAPVPPPAAMGHIPSPAGIAPKPSAAPIPLVDVTAKLDVMAAKLPQKPNWKVSIADLLFLLGMDNSLKARKELAQELGCPADLMGGDSSKMNIWLHKTVLKKIAENGGSVPQELLD